MKLNRCVLTFIILSTLVRCHVSEPVWYFREARSYEKTAWLELAFGHAGTVGLISFNSLHKWRLTRFTSILDMLLILSWTLRMIYYCGWQVGGKPLPITQGFIQGTIQIEHIDMFPLHVLLRKKEFHEVTEWSVFHFMVCWNCCSRKITFDWEFRGLQRDENNFSNRSLLWIQQCSR